MTESPTYDDMSLDAVILSIGHNLLSFTSDIRLCIITEIYDDSKAESGIRYCCSLCAIFGSPVDRIMTAAQIDEWRLRQVIWCASAQDAYTAKRNLLTELLEKLRSALEVPVQKIMNT